MPEINLTAKKGLPYDLWWLTKNGVIADIPHKRFAWSIKKEVLIKKSGTTSSQAHERTIMGVIIVVESLPRCYSWPRMVVKYCFQKAAYSSDLVHSFYATNSNDFLIEECWSMISQTKKGQQCLGCGEMLSKDDSLSSKIPPGADTKFISMEQRIDFIFFTSHEAIHQTR